MRDYAYARATYRPAHPGSVLGVATIEPTMAEAGRWVLSDHEMQLPRQFFPGYSAVVHLGAHAIGGNHRHERAEVFMAVAGQLSIRWIEPDGSRFSLPMQASGEGPQAFYVPPWVPHAVINEGDTSAALLEWATTAGGPVIMLEDADSLVAPPSLDSV